MEEFELENRIKNLMWTVSGDYSLEFKPDLAAFAKSKYVALYDGIKQGAFARYFNREEYSLYLVKRFTFMQWKRRLWIWHSFALNLRFPGRL